MCGLSLSTTHARKRCWRSDKGSRESLRWRVLCVQQWSRLSSLHFVPDWLALSPVAVAAAIAG